MTDQKTQPATRLWTRDGFREDEWRHAAEGESLAETLASNARTILPLAAFLAAEAERAAEPGRFGVRLMPGDPVDSIVPFLDTLPMVALAFPNYNDGRSYSKAALLRTRYGYKGAIRASGDVLIDQISLMARTGFDEFEVTNPTALKRLEAGRQGGLPLHYQSSSDEASEAGERYSWRRVPK